MLQCLLVNFWDCTCIGSNYTYPGTPSHFIFLSTFFLWAFSLIKRKRVDIIFWIENGVLSNCGCHLEFAEVRG